MWIIRFSNGMYFNGYGGLTDKLEKAKIYKRHADVLEVSRFFNERTDRTGTIFHNLVASDVKVKIEIEEEE